MDREARLFKEWYEEYAQDPEYIAQGLLYAVADGICAAMKRQNMTRRGLAAKLGVTPQYVTKFLNTPSNTSLLQIVRFATAVGLEVDLAVKPQRAARAPGKVSAKASRKAELVAG